MASISGTSSTDGKSIYNLILVGECEVGKTSIVRRFTDHGFRYQYVHTVGIDFHYLDVGEDTQLRIRDASGDDAYDTLVESYIATSRGIILVYDVTDRSSFDYVRDKLRHIVPRRGWLRKTAETPEDREMMIVGNKCDLEAEREVSSEEGRMLADQHHCLFMETSAQSNINIRETLNAFLPRSTSFSPLPVDFSPFDSAKPVAHFSIDISAQNPTINLPVFGLKLDVDPSSLSPDAPPVMADVKVYADEETLSLCTFPEETNAVSAVYSINLSDPTIPVRTLRIQHNANFNDHEELKQLKFVKAVNESSARFEEVPGGIFILGEDYGEIRPSHMCLWSIVGKIFACGRKTRYRGSIFYHELEPVPTGIWAMELMVIKNDSGSQTALNKLKEEFSNMSIQDSDFLFTFDEDSLKLIPYMNEKKMILTNKRVIKCKNGWEVVCDKLKILQDTVDRFKDSIDVPGRCTIKIHTHKKNKYKVEELPWFSLDGISNNDKTEIQLFPPVNVSESDKFEIDLAKLKSELRNCFGKTPTIRAVFGLLKPRSMKWNTLGEELEVPYNYREELFREKNPSEAKMEAIINRWIESECSPVTWGNVRGILHRNRWHDVANLIIDAEILKVKDEELIRLDKSTAVLPCRRGRVGIKAEMKVKVITRDSSEKELATGGSEVRAILTCNEGECPVTYNNDGTYTVSVIPQQLGQHQLYITVNCQYILGSPFSLDIVPQRDYTKLNGPIQTITGIEDPTQIAFTDNGDMFVISGSGDHCIHVYDESGNKKTTIGSWGDGELQFRWPEGIDINGEVVYVVENASNRIHQLTTGGEFIGTFGEEGSAIGQFSRPSDVKISPDGKVYVADTDNDRIQVFNPDWSISHVIDSALRSQGLFLTSPHGIAFDPLSGNVHVVGHAIYSHELAMMVFTASGQFVYYYNTNTPFYLPIGQKIAIDSSGYSHLACNNDYGNYKLFIVDSKRTLFQHALVDGLEHPNVSISPVDGSVWISDAKNKRLLKYYFEILILD